MARQQSKEQKDTIERVMHEYKHGDLRMRGTGPKVKNPKQAIAIALKEAGASNRESAAANRRTLRETKAKERRAKPARSRSGGERTKAELYEEARRRDIAGRSRMTKDQLARALNA